MRRWRWMGPFAVAIVLVAHASGAAQSLDGWRTDFSRHTVPLDEIVPGGPPKDGIPAIDEPRFESTAAADRWLADSDPVIVVESDGRTRAYPYGILIWHEIVNDRIGAVPFAITYCPLCNIALVFDRRHRGRVLDFGATGRLRHSDLVMYDRQTESWWQQATGEAIVGEFAGDELEIYASQTVSWAAYREAHPDGRVLSRDTGYDKPYGRNPYTGYDAPGGGPIGRFFRKDTDDRLPAMERVVAVELDEAVIAYPYGTVRRERVVNDDVGGRPIVVLWASGTASALDRTRIAEGRDVGATGVFSRRVDGRALTFEAVGEAFRDRETGTRWNLLGQAVSGPLAGRELEALVHGNYLWFAWAAFRPETDVRR